MSATSTLINFFSNLSNNTQIKKKEFKQKKTFSIIKVINLLIEIGLINGYKNINEHYISIYLKYYNNQPIISQIISISTPNKSIYIKNKNVYKLLNQNEIYILSTSQGFLTQNQAILQNIGGELICKII